MLLWWNRVHYMDSVVCYVDTDDHEDEQSVILQTWLGAFQNSISSRGQHCLIQSAVKQWQFIFQLEQYLQ